MAHKLAVLRLRGAQRAAQRADALVGVVVHPFARERGASTVGAAVAIAGQGTQALAQQLALQIGAEVKHGPGIRRQEPRSFRLFAHGFLVIFQGYVRIRTNCQPYAPGRGAGGSGERWSHSCRAPLLGPVPSAVKSAATSSRWLRRTPSPTAPAAAARRSRAPRCSGRARASRG